MKKNKPSQNNEWKKGQHRETDIEWKMWTMWRQVAAVWPLTFDVSLSRCPALVIQSALSKGDILSLITFNHSLGKVSKRKPFYSLVSSRNEIWSEFWPFIFLSVFFFFFFFFFVFFTLENDVNKFRARLLSVSFAFF